MRRTPLFTQTARGEPQGYHFLAMALSALLPAVVPAEQMPNYTWHSFRIGLACALRAAQAPGWVLLALLRWRSPSSIPGYGRFSFETAASWLDQASSQEASSRQATNLPSTALDMGQVSEGNSYLSNALSPEAYSYLDRAWAQNLPTSALASIHANLPQYNDDNFMSELTTFTDTSPSNGTRPRDST